MTNVLQNLRTCVGKTTFDAWYGPKEAEMRADELMRWFYKIRSELLKEGLPGVAYHGLHNVTIGDDGRAAEVAEVGETIFHFLKPWPATHLGQPLQDQTATHARSALRGISRMPPHRGP